jgi:3-hydroxybutyryl-CoA dehydrogenase
MGDFKKVSVVGAGQMGGGIAQVSAASGLETVVYDVSADAIARCQKTNDKLFARAVEKQRMTEAEAKAAQNRLSYVTDLHFLAESDIVIEAIIEDAGI